MSRSSAEDVLQGFRFRIVEVEGNAGVFADEAPVAGFNNVSFPNITIEGAEYRTGNEVWARKFGGIVTVEDSTMTRGILLGDTTMYNWVMNKYLGRVPYRTDFEVRVYNQETLGIDPDDKPARTMIYHNAIPNSVKLMGDLDASSSDVSLQEVGVSLEFITLDAPASVA